MPDTAHGTNPATVTMGGYEVVKVGTDADGDVDLDDLRAKADDDVACLMLTNPNTLGLFDPNIAEIAEIVHGAGATLYYDGANLNAIMGIVAPGDMGFDIVHFNLHKTFTKPHGGGGPGAGPIAVSDRIEPYLPLPRVVRARGRRSFDLVDDRPQVDRPPARLPGQLRHVRALLRLHPLAGRRRPPGDVARPPCSTRTTCSPGCARRARRSTCRRLRPHLHARVRALGRADEARARRSRRSTSPSACSTSASTRRPSTSRCWSTRRCSSSRPRPRRKETLDAFADAVADDPARGRARTPRSRGPRRTRRRSAASTRPARPSVHRSGSRSSAVRIVPRP